MVEIRPFRGVRYNPEVVKDLASVLAPPYDIITSKGQAELYQRSPFNIIRLEFGKPQPEDTPQSNRYTRAQAALKDWLQKEVIVAEADPALYLCHHYFQHQGQSYVRRELTVLVRLEEWEKGVILPHEHTLPEPKDDRLRLLKAIKANISPVYGLYKDPGGQVAAILRLVEEKNPDLEIPHWKPNDDGTEAGFRIWVIKDGEAIKGLVEALAHSNIYIADGHHRYETALAYRKERTAGHASSGEEPFNYVMMGLTALSDPGLLVLPLHRLVRGLDASRKNGLKDKLGELFGIEHLPLRQDSLEKDLGLVQTYMREDRPGLPTFGLLGLEYERVLILRPRYLTPLRDAMPAAWAESLKQLDVSLLHAAILQGLLGIGKDPREVEEHLAFTPYAEEAAGRVMAGEYQLAFLVNPILVEQMVEVAEAGCRMPQKTTYFYPKLPTGLVMNLLDG